MLSAADGILAARQRFAFANPANKAMDLADAGPYQQIRKHATGLLLLTTLAVDR